MQGFFENMGLFLLGIGSILFALSLYSLHKLGSFAKFTAYFAKVEGPGILKGIVAAVAVLVLFALAAKVLHAETIIFAGIDRTSRVSPHCKSEGINDRLTSNVGFRHKLGSIKDVSFWASYTHHSCVLNRDRLIYDAGGLSVQWSIR